MRDVIDSIVRRLIPYPKNIGLAVGVTQGEHSDVYGYGVAGETDKEPPQGNTLFEIGSVTKVFTTALLALLVAEEKINLHDQVCDFVPELSNLSPDITLERLATHTSGLPKMPSNVYGTMLRHRSNPYANYPVDEMFRYLSRYKSKRKLIGKIAYSNLGVALLGHVLANEIGMSYEQAIISEICEKLGMSDTRIVLDSEQKDRLVTPHNAKGNPSHNWDLPAFAGAGALRSSVDDLIKFLKASLGIIHSPLTGAFQQCHEKHWGVFSQPNRLLRLFPNLAQRRKEFDLYSQGIGLGWVIGSLASEGQPIHWHHGATGGYIAFIGFVKSSSTGAVVLANRGPRTSEQITGISMVDEIGFKILEYLNPSG